MPVKCPRCDSWMQMRYGILKSSYICTQCGYLPRIITTNSTSIEKPYVGLLTSDYTELKGDTLEINY